MKHLYYAFGIVSMLCQWVACPAYAQVGVQWEKGTYQDFPNFQTKDVIATKDSSHLLVGYTPGGYNSVNDYQIIKIDLQGNKLWEKTFGGKKNDELYTAVATADGGYLLGGVSNSPISGDKSQGNQGDFDYWVIKVDAQGNKEWDKTFGGSKADVLHKVVLAPDGGYLLAGTSRSGDSYEKSQPSRDAYPNCSSYCQNGDYWIVRIDASGKKLWDRTFGASAKEQLEDAVADENGRYLLVGWSTSGASGDKSEPGRDDYTEEYWVVNVDDEGNKVWDKTLGGPYMSVAKAGAATADGGYIIAGFYVPPSIYPPYYELGTVDHKIIKLDAAGEIVWEINRGGNYDDVPTNMVAAEDGGFLIVGRSNSDASGAKSEGILGHDESNAGGNRPFDAWIYKINSAGKKLWDKTLPGGSELAVAPTPNQSYVLAGNYYIQYIHETDVVIKGFRLVNAETGKDIGWLKNKDLLELNKLGNPKMNIKAIPSPLKVDSVIFKLTGPVAHQSTERYWPYALFGDKAGDDDRVYLGKKLRPGNRYVLSVVPYLDGYAGAEKKIEFRVTQEFNITLEWATGSGETGELTDGSELPNEYLTVFAHFSPENIPGVRVDFELSGPINHTQIENASPYVLFGEFVEYHYEGVNYRLFPPGAYTLKAVPYLFDKAGPERIISFTVTAPEDANAAQTSSVEVFPVPSTGILQVEHENMANATLQVIDFTGNTVLTKPLGTQSMETLDLSSFKKGIYYVKVLSQEGVTTKRIVIE